MTHNWPSYYYTVPTVSFAILYNIPKFFELKTETRYYHQTYNETEEKNSTDLQTVTETYEVIIWYMEIMFQGTFFFLVFVIFGEYLFFLSSQYLIVVGTSLRKNPHYYQGYVMYLSLLINALLPLLALSFLNTQVLLSLRKRIICKAVFCQITNETKAYF